MRKVMIEVRCNEYAMRDRNPHVPWSPQEIADEAARCREAGAAIVHFHARDAETGAASHEPSVYAEIVRRIREACDLVITPTLGVGSIADPLERMQHITSMATDTATKPDFAPIDTSSANIDPYLPGKGFLSEDGYFVNTIAAARAQLALLREADVRPEMILWTPGGGRVIEAFLADGTLDAPVLAQLQLSDLLLSALPATPRGLLGMLEFLPKQQGLEWIALNAAGNALPLVTPVVQLGGHISLGLGDDPYSELGTPTNADVIAEAARLVRHCGAEVATPDEARELLGLT